MLHCVRSIWLKQMHSHPLLQSRQFSHPLRGKVGDRIAGRAWLRVDGSGFPVRARKFVDGDILTVQSTAWPFFVNFSIKSQIAHDV